MVAWPASAHTPSTARRGCIWYSLMTGLAHLFRPAQPGHVGASVLSGVQGPKSTPWRPELFYMYFVLTMIRSCIACTSGAHGEVARITKGHMRAAKGTWGLQRSHEGCKGHMRAAKGTVPFEKRLGRMLSHANNHLVGRATGVYVRVMLDDAVCVVGSNHHHMHLLNLNLFHKTPPTCWHPICYKPKYRNGSKESLVDIPRCSGFTQQVSRNILSCSKRKKLFQVSSGFQLCLCVLWQRQSPDVCRTGHASCRSPENAWNVLGPSQVCDCWLYQSEVRRAVRRATGVYVRVMLDDAACVVGSNRHHMHLLNLNLFHKTPPTCWHPICYKPKYRNGSKESLVDIPRCSGFTQQVSRNILSCSKRKKLFQVSSGFQLCLCVLWQRQSPDVCRTGHASCRSPENAWNVLGPSQVCDCWLYQSQGE